MGEESIKKSLVFAYYITGHGFGHATRAAEIVRNLIQAGHSVHVVSGAPEYVFTTAIESPRLIIRKVLLDTGAVQADALTVDRFASLETYIATAVVPRASILAVEVQWLKSIKADLVVSDVVPVACRAAADAGIPSVCVTNFSWDFIYAEYVMAAGHDNRSIIWQIAEDYSQCEFLIRLPGYCPMPAFRDVVDVPLVVRRLHKSREEVRKELGVKDDVKVLVYNFGGQLSGWNLKEEYLPSGWICWVCGASNSQKLPKNFVKLPKNIYTPDVVAAADCMLGKIGYGTASEALAYGVPFIFVRRDYFNEEPFLRHMLEQFQCGVEMIRRDLLTGHWEPYLKRAITLKPCYEGGKNGAEVAASILQDATTGKHDTSSMHSGSRRLQDAIILGYQLQGVPGVDIAVPEWYTAAQNELSSCTASPNDKPVEASSLKMQNADYEILHGDHHGLSDTMGFIKSLIELRDLSNPGNTNGHHARETLAAGAMFSWEEEIVVTRAPGRLDVMGGIADYSGSLVLQMPIKEACHVAIQRNHPSKQKLWKHAQARQQTEAPKPVIQIVSFGSELSNRGPTFDMDLSDLMDGDKPISYEKARKYFSQDPSQKWAAYAAGTFLVLMIELGVRFEDSISMLVSSRVPEGKGVSSSAAVEVACMSALAAAYGLDIAPRDLALLCQKVENHVVGAPCGVMDQMASACGEANKLLAMICQPAEVLGLVEIPPHIRFWGIDSGIRHSVGGADYGSVRIGAFMGRKIIKSAASKSLSVNSSQKANGNISDLKDYDAKSLLDSEAFLDYLCNMSPHRFESSYSIKIPEALHGQDFLDKYVNHEDSVTVIDKKHTYSVRAPATHPIYENFRVKAFKAMLSAVPSDDQLSSLGELMYQCHNSYNNCGLGSDGTDRLVELVQEVQHCNLSKSDSGTLFGAKITGGGSGGTVCAIGRNCLKSSEEIIKIQSTYKAATGYLPYIFEGSSPGAGKFGYLKLRLKSDSK